MATDIASFPALGTPAEATDGIVCYDSSAAAGSRATVTLFDNTATNYLNGQGGWSVPAGDGLGSAAAADVVALWTTCTGYLKSDGTCDTPAGGVDTSGTPVQYDIARFTDADTIEGVSYAEFFALHDDITWGAAAGGSQTWTWDTGAATDPTLVISDDGFMFSILKTTSQTITDNSVVTVDAADAASGQMARFTANGVEGVSSITNIAILLGVPADPTVDLTFGRDAAYNLTLGQSGTTTHTFFKGDDTATNGDTTKGWSADKIYDQLALKENTVSAGSLADNSVYSADINTIVDTISWNAGGTNSDGTQCAAAAKITINSGPQVETTICADNDASTIYGHVKMPDSWNGGTVTMASEYIQTAADTGVLNGDIACQCRGAGETVNNTWGTEIAIDDAAVTGSSGSDITTSAAITCDGTCAGGDVLYWRYQMDATGTTTAVATLHFVGWSMEYTSNVGD